MGQEDELMLSYGLRRSGPESIIFIPGLGASKSSFGTCFELASNIGLQQKFILPLLDKQFTIIRQLNMADVRTIY